MMPVERRYMSFETAKILGLIGALFLVVSVFGSSAGNALGLVGIVLLLFSFHELADYYGDRSIFDNVLKGIIIFLVGVVVASVIIGVAAAGALNQIGISMSSWSNPTAWQGIDWNSVNYNTLAPYIAAMGVALIIVFVLTIIAAYFIRKSFKTMALRSHVAMFDTSGLLLFIGAILTIIIVGLILLWVAMILLTIAFFRLRPELPAPPVQPAVTPSP